jgi:predicted MFS family arabinose efflux permease
VGPLLGGLTLPFGESVPFLLAAAMMLPCLGVLWFGLPAHAPHPAAVVVPDVAAADVPALEAGATGPVTARGDAVVPASRSGWRDRWREQNVIALLRRDPVLARLAALQLAYTLGLNAMYEYAPLWMLEQAGLGSRGIAAVTAGQCALMTVASAFAGRFARAGGAHPLKRASLVALIAAIGIASLGVLPGGVGCALLVVLGVPTALYNAVLPAWVSERFAAHGQGRIMGLLATIFCCANVVIALAGGGLAILSSRWIMGVGGAACIVASMLTWRLAVREAARPAGREGEVGAC